MSIELTHCLFNAFHSQEEDILGEHYRLFYKEKIKRCEKLCWEVQLFCRYTLWDEFVSIGSPGPSKLLPFAVISLTLHSSVPLLPLSISSRQIVATTLTALYHKQTVVNLVKNDHKMNDYHQRSEKSVPKGGPGEENCFYF